MDGFSADLDFEKRRAETGSIAFRTAQEEVAEELHFHLFKAESAAAVAAAVAGVEGKTGGCEACRLGSRRVGKEIADVFVNAEINGRSRAGSLRKWRLIHHDDFVHLLVTADGFHKPCSLILRGVFANELPVEDIAHERGFSRAGNACYCAEHAKWELGSEVLDIVVGDAFENDMAFSFAAFFWNRDGFSPLEVIGCEGVFC